jgi:hypothetical protein
MFLSNVQFHTLPLSLNGHHQGLPILLCASSYQNLILTLPRFFQDYMNLTHKAHENEYPQYLQVTRREKNHVKRPISILENLDCINQFLHRYTRDLPLCHTKCCGEPLLFVDNIFETEPGN